MAIAGPEMRTDAYINAEAPVILWFIVAYCGLLVNTLLGFLRFASAHISPAGGRTKTHEVCPGGHRRNQLKYMEFLVLWPFDWGADSYQFQLKTFKNNWLCLASYLIGSN